MSTVWKLARQLAGSAIGPRQKRRDLAASANPTLSKWCEAVAMSGPEGGYCAVHAVVGAAIAVCTESSSPASQVQC